MAEKKPDKILVLDFGSQYTQLIARRIREEKVYSEIRPYNISLKEIKAFNPSGIILSGSPSTVTKRGAPRSNKKIFDLDLPILGICYGMHLLTWQNGGKMLSSNLREYGQAKISINKKDPFFNKIRSNGTVWMSHGDHVEKVPPGFEVIAGTDSIPVATMKHKTRPIYGVQYHPEVTHTKQGRQFFKNFLFEICGCKPNWNLKSFIRQTVTDVREQVGDSQIICGLSGGVDSSVAAALVHKAIGKQLTCIFVNNGVLRAGEAEKVIETFENNFKIPLRYVDAENEFLKALKGVVDPERKRKVIGNLFIKVFEREAKKIGHPDFLVQGTLYPDVIESVSVKGPSATIKSHHNVGGLPEKMGLKLVEPLRELFKDEARKVGKELGIPDEIILRQPFPGPGLAIRTIGEVRKKDLDVLRQADTILLSEIKEAGLYEKMWQSFAVFLPVKTVGVMGDERSYENVVALRAVQSTDAMTADWVELPYSLLKKVSNRIINEVKGVNRVVYDISSKPPSTIEWE